MAAAAGRLRRPAPAAPPVWRPNPHRPSDEELQITHQGDAMQNTIYTVGHSTRTIGDFVKLIQAYEIETVVDVRKIAKSRHNPQYND
jgi:hypothetical protein